jgi:dTMP kinase
VLEGDPDRWSPETEILLFTAARRDHLEKTIRPALARGDVVITDRFADSTRMYQGISRGDLRSLVDDLHTRMIGVEPDLTLLIDIDPDVGLGRAQARAGAEQRFEDMGVALQAKMRDGFLTIAREFRARFRVIDGARDPAAVAADVLAVTLAHLDAVG